jgi:hypothetical protein
MNIELLNKRVIAEYLTREAPWSGSHGAEHEYLGLGLLYYTIVYALKAQVAVCLGTGGATVPRLMRQAQRDLGIGETSRTIVVDGNRPEAGWGAPAWLDPNSFFRRFFSDVHLVIDLTVNAARNFFAPQNIRIDYLHIDADHSYAGCLEDFQTYWPFLHEGSIVTLHDTNFPTAGVKHVVEYIRTLADCEVIDFRDMWAGTALVRVGETAHGPRFRSLRHAERDHLIGVTRHADAPPLAPPEKEWKYLESRAFSTRYVLAAHFVHGCRSVIEIGGANMRIDQFLTGAHDSVLVLDPYIRESYTDRLHGIPCEVAHVRARFQDVDWHIPPTAEYGLVMLGLEIQGLTPQQYEVLYDLVNRAKVTVIEFSTSWAPSREQFGMIVQHTRTKETFQAKLNLAGNECGNLENSWPPRCDREIHVLEPHG